MNILYTVFGPETSFSRTRWVFYQHEDGSVTRSIRGPKFGESKPHQMNVSSAFPDALSWARCLHGGKPHFKECAEAEEIYSTLHNVALYVQRDELVGARVCLDGIIEDCQEWKRRLQEAAA